MWKIVENKNGTKRWQKQSNVTSKSKRSKRLLKLENDESNEKVLFVFYTFDNIDSWSYGKLPNGWRWVGSGTTEKKSNYDQEEQFMGPKKKIKEMHNFLNNYFTNLKQKRIIKKYKIEKSYSP